MVFKNRGRRKHNNKFRRLTYITYFWVKFQTLKIFNLKIHNLFYIFYLETVFFYSYYRRRKTIRF